MHVEMNEAQFYRLQIQTTREEAPAVLTALDNEPGLATRARSSMDNGRTLPLCLPWGTS